MKDSKPKKIAVFDMFFSFLFPMLVGKALVIYFGSYYSSDPGSGYGYGLAASIIFTLLMVARFLWKYRDYGSS